ncbi:two-component regulator propeller domain-containing protein [Cytophagaceae bacterium ABcell3]|nr:two-component regulator propeller domain-containing protein [Cytophagaceae bacterium ABcell3]
MIKYFFIVLLLVFTTNISFSSNDKEKPFLVFHTLSIVNGISDNIVRGITEDKEGFMWFITENGLNRYDGIDFKIYKSTSAPYSISSNDQKVFFTDSKQRLWVGTRNGLNMYDNISDQFYNFKSDDYEALKYIKGDIDQITEDTYGNIWVTVQSEGLYKISDLNKKPDNFQFKPEENVGIFVGLSADKNGNVWVGTRDGLLKLNVSTGEFRDLRPLYGSGYHVMKIIADNQGRIWMATSSGLRYIDSSGKLKVFQHEQNKPYSIKGNNVYDIFPYDENRLLLAVDGRGIDIFDLRTEKFYHYSDENEAQLPCKNITSVYKDSKGGIWAGTFMHGLAYSNSTTNLFTMFKHNSGHSKGIAKGIITYFLEDQAGNLWFSTDGGGLYVKWKNSLFPEAYEPVPGKGNISEVPIVSMLQDQNNNLWLATYGGGLKVFNTDKKEIKTYLHEPDNPKSLGNDKIRYLYEDKKGNIWTSGFSTGLSVLDIKTNTFKHYTHNPKDPNTISSNMIQSFFEDSEGTLWGTSFNGLTKYIPEKDCFKNYTFSSPIFSQMESNFTSDVVEDKEGNLWLASNGAGLIRFNPKNETYDFFTTKHGLSDNRIKNITLDDKNHLWLVTYTGLTRFSLETLQGIPFTYKDGVPAYSYYPLAKYKDKHGRIYLGTNMGYLVIDPRHLVKNETVPPVVVTNIEISEKTVEDTSKTFNATVLHKKNKPIDLQHNQNGIRIDFAVLNFNNPQKNKYAYKLEGFDPVWIRTTEQRTATYTNLDPGTYTFKVIGANNDNVWNKKGVSFTFTIYPPWWKTWWFNLIAFSLSFIALIGVVQWRTLTERRKSFNLEKEVRQRTKELKESNEQLDAFVYKASHDIKGPLKSIIGLTTIGQKDVKDPVAQNYFSHILKSTSKLEKLLSDLLMLTKVKSSSVNIDKIDPNQLINEALDNFKHFPGFNKIKINKEITENKHIYTDRNLLYSIVQNLIENPIKYYDAEKEENFLNITIDINPDKAILTFRDNGKGIDKEYQSKVFDMFFKINESSVGTGLGLYIVKTTIDKLDGTISLQSEEGIGSTFTIVIPNKTP